MPTRSILNEIESCCRGPLLHEKVYFYKKSRREKGENGFEEEGGKGKEVDREKKEEEKIV